MVERARVLEPYVLRLDLCVCLREKGLESDEERKFDGRILFLSQ